MSSKVQFAGVSDRTDCVRRQKTEANKSALISNIPRSSAIASCELFGGQNYYVVNKKEEALKKTRIKPGGGISRMITIKTKQKRLYVF